MLRAGLEAEAKFESRENDLSGKFEGQYTAFVLRAG